MKKAFSIYVTVAFAVVLLAGCLDEKAVNTVAITSAARVAGYTLAQDNPALAAVALPQAQTLLAAADGDEVQFTEVLFPAAVTLLQKGNDNPLIAASISDLIGLVEAGDTVSVPVRAEMMRAAVQGFSEGLMLYGAETAEGK